MSAGLAELPQQIWAALQRGSREPSHGFHWPVLASLQPHGAPDARTVVLRQVEPDQRVLHIHSHRRAGKIAQLRARPPVCLVFHDPASRTQVRVHGEAVVHVDDAVSAHAWQGLPDHSRALYRDAADLAVLRIRADALDWLLLAPDGHRRAALHWSAGAWQGEWREP